MKNQKFLLGLVFVLRALSFGTVLGDLANGMKPGEWRKLTTVGLTSSFLETYGNYCCHHSIVAYTGKAVWNPISKEFLYHGSPHANPQKLVIYSDATNSWRAGTASPIGIHSYYCNTIDAATGTFYIGAHVNGDVRKYNAANDSWSSVTNGCSYCYTYGGVEYFPERNGFLAVGDKGAFWCAMPQGSWSSIPQFPSSGVYSPFCVYSHTAKAVLFGGYEASKIYMMEASGAVTKKANSPIPIGGTSGGGNIAVDPVSGKFIAYRRSPDAQIHEYNAATNAWTSIASPPPADIRKAFPISVAAAPVSTYGVIMYLGYQPDSSLPPTVYLYKHTASSTGGESARGALAAGLRAAPNPFRGEVLIEGVPAAARFEIYTVRGERVAVLAPLGRAPKGTAAWRPRGIPAGVYLLKLQAVGLEEIVQKLYLQK